MNIADIFDSLQETYPKELVVRYEQLSKDAWLFMTDCDNDLYSCFVHLKDKFIWKVTEKEEIIRKTYELRLRLKNVRGKNG